jgi:hypothetical protein
VPAATFTEKTHEICQFFYILVIWYIKERISR